MRFVPSSEYGAMGPDGLETGVYVLDNYLYQYMPSGDLLLRAEPGNDYSDRISQNDPTLKLQDPGRAQVIAELKSRGRLLSGKDAIALERDRVSRLAPQSGTPMGFTADTDPENYAASFLPSAIRNNLRQPWFWVATIGGVGLAGYMGYTIYKSRK